MTKRLQVLSSGLIVLFGLVALAAAYWGVVASSEVLSRDDNPRLVESELRVQRGSILDRNGIVLAETQGEPGQLERIYNGIGVYSPAVGYYSMRYGVSGVEASYDDVLRGKESNPWREWWRNFIHRDPVGQVLQLTLDAEVQAAADAALGEWQGAAVVLNARDGEILALVSHPPYDPNELDEQFEALNEDSEAPLLSRPTQARFQPGTALQPLLLAAMFESGLTESTIQLGDLTEPVSVDDVQLGCAKAPQELEGTIVTALSHACPAPFVELAELSSAVDLVASLDDLGLFTPPPVPLEVIAGSLPALDDQNLLRSDEAAGQGQLTLSPLQMAWAMAAIANDGDLPSLRLVRRIGSSGIVIAQDVDVLGVTTETANRVKAMMLEGMVSGTATPAGIDGVDVAAHVGMAIAGPAGEVNSWFLGIAPANIPQPFARYVVVLLMEGATDPTTTALAGRQVLESLLDSR